MTVSEYQRFRMHQELRRVLGDDVGNTVMEHLPPLGWGDVARTKDVQHVEENLALRIDHIEKRLKGITGALWVMVASVVTVSTAIIVMLVQINLNIASL